jgi:serine/threonine protein kinase
VLFESLQILNVLQSHTLNVWMLQDLLSKILVADPNDRYTIKNIIQHPWFQTDLPSRALKMNDDYIQLTPEGQGFQQLDEIKAILNEAKIEPKTVRKKEVGLWYITRHRTAYF